MRIRNNGGAATITLKNGESEISTTVPANSAGWVSFDASKIDRTKTYEIVTNTGTLELGGVRLDRDSQLYWPWDQGATLTYHRDIPYQFTADITFRYDSHEIFPVGMTFDVINDHEATILAKLRS